MTIKIVIADDHDLLRAAIGALLTRAPDLQVIGEARTGDEALDLAQQLAPDLVLLDIAMPGTDGLAVTRAIGANCPLTRVLILTASEEGEVLNEALAAGAAGYLVKRAVEAELLSAIAAVMRGDLYLDPSVTRTLLQKVGPFAAQAEPEGTEALTPREREIVALLARGLTSTQIAAALQLSRRTVENHRANIMAKLDASSRADIVRYAAAHGLLPTGAPAKPGSGKSRT